MENRIEYTLRIQRIDAQGRMDGDRIEKLVSAPCLPRVGDKIWGMDNGRRYLVEEVYHNIRPLDCEKRGEAKVIDLDVEVIELR